MRVFKPSPQSIYELGGGVERAEKDTIPPGRRERVQQQVRLCRLGQGKPVLQGLDASHVDVDVRPQVPGQAQQQDFSKVQIKATKVSGNIYMLEGAGGKILGVVVNQVPTTALRGYYKQYYNSYIRKDGK